MVFARFYGLQIIGVTTFHGYQRNIVCAAVDKFYKQEQVRVILQVMGYFVNFSNTNSWTMSKTKMLYCQEMEGVILLEKVQNTALIQ